MNIATKEKYIFNFKMSKQMTKLTFVELLKRGNSEIKSDRADRIAKGAFRAYTKLVMDLEAKRDNILEAIEASKDLSTSNSVNSINAIRDFDAERWTKRFQDNAVELELCERELVIASGCFNELFGGEINFETGEVSEVPSVTTKKNAKK